MKQIVTLYFKLRMFGVPVNASTNVLCDNLNVVKNSSKIEFELNKKHSSVAYHVVRWSVAASIIRIGQIDGNDKYAGALTQHLPVIKKE